MHAWDSGEEGPLHHDGPDRTVGGAPFVIDTGADHLYLDSELAKTLNPSSWGERESLGAKPGVKWGMLATFEVGPWSCSTPSSGDGFFGASASFGRGSPDCLDTPSSPMPSWKWIIRTGPSPASIPRRTTTRGTGSHSP